jgi:hypothetical protein
VMRERADTRSQDLEVKRKAIGVALEMVSSRNVEDVVLFMKKQLQSTMEQEYDKVNPSSGHSDVFLRGGNGKSRS